MTEAYLGLGSNLGDRSGHLKAAVTGLGSVDGVRIKAISSIYRTEPIGFVDQDAFFNAVVRVETELEPLELLERCLEIERNRGRERLERWGPRTLDIDLLVFGDRSSRDERLTLPHPMIAERAFVLVPLLELWPKAEIGGLSVKSFLDKLGADGVERLIAFEDCETVAIVGASLKPDRYSNRAQRMLTDFGHSVIPVSAIGVDVLGVAGYPNLESFGEQVDAVTLYVGPARQEEIIAEILVLPPKRVIFNPGTESVQSETTLEAAGIKAEQACTLVLLQTGQF